MKIKIEIKKYLQMLIHYLISNYAVHVKGLLTLSETDLIENKVRC